MKTQVEFATVLAPLVNDLFGAGELARDLLKLLLVLSHLTLHSTECLDLDEKARRAGSSTATEGTRGVVDIAVEGDGADANALVKSNGLRGLLVLADEDIAKDVCHGGADVLVIAHEIEGQVHLAWCDTLGSSNLLGGHAERVNLVERDNGDALAQATLVEQCRADLFVLDNDVVHFATGANLQSRRARVVGLFQVDESGNETLDLRAVKVGVRVRVCKVDGGKS